MGLQRTSVVGRSSLSLGCTDGLAVGRCPIAHLSSSDRFLPLPFFIPYWRNPIFLRICVSVADVICSGRPFRVSPSVIGLPKPDRACSCWALPQPSVAQRSRHYFKRFQVKFKRRRDTVLQRTSQTR